MTIHNTVIYSVFLFLVLSLQAQAQTQVIGATYAIAEPDALEEIRQPATAVNWQERLRDTLRYYEVQAYRLPEATEDRSRMFTPEYVTPFDVTDKDGNLVYRKGFRYNILEHVVLPMRIMVFGRYHLEWVRSNRKETDVLLLADDGLKKVMKDLGVTVYPMTGKISSRLGVEKVPAIVKQKNDHFLIQEFNLESTDD